MIGSEPSKLGYDKKLDMNRVIQASLDHPSPKVMNWGWAKYFKVIQACLDMNKVIQACLAHSQSSPYSYPIFYHMIGGEPSKLGYDKKMAHPH